MERRFTHLLILFLMAIQAFAAPVSQERALKIAKGLNDNNVKLKMHKSIPSFVEKASKTYDELSHSLKADATEEWTEWTEYEHPTGTFTLSLYFSGAFPEVPVMYREYQLDNTKAQFLFQLSVYGGGFDLIVDYDKNTNKCQVAPQFATTHPNYGQVTVSDIPHYPLQPGFTYDQFPCTYDPEKGLFTLNLIYFVSTDYNANANGSFGNGVETFQLDGFYVYDYSITLEYLGKYVDEQGNEFAEISATKGKDVAKYLMTLVSADADIKATSTAMIDGSLACDEFTESISMAYPVTESGEYMAIAVSFDIDGKHVGTETINFEFFKTGEDPWVSLGMATYVEDCMTTLWNVENVAYEVEVRENKDQPGLFRMINPYGAAYPYNSEGKFDASKEYYIEIDATDPEGVYIPGIYGTGMNWGYGEVSISSMAYYYMTNQGVPFQDVKDAGYCGTYADNIITFPAEALLISMADYAGGASYKSNVNGAFVLDMSMLAGIEAVADNMATARFDGNTVYAPEGMTIEIYNAAGMLVIGAQGNISVAELAPGIYIAKCGNKSIKILKK